MSDGTKLQACGLWKKTSKAGKSYLIGRWGGVKVLILENSRRAGENDPSHHLIITEAPDRTGRQPRQNRRQDAGSTSPDPSQRQARTHRQGPSAPAGEASAGEAFHDDPLPWTAGG